MKKRPEAKSLIGWMTQAIGTREVISVALCVAAPALE